MPTNDNNEVVGIDYARLTQRIQEDVERLDEVPENAAEAQPMIQFNYTNTSATYYGAPIIARMETYICSGCGSEKEGIGYIHIAENKIDICPKCSAKMFRWMMNRANSSILND